MKFEGLLSCSQVFIAGRFPEPAESRPHPHTLFLIRFNIILKYTPTSPIISDTRQFNQIVITN